MRSVKVSINIRKTVSKSFDDVLFFGVWFFGWFHPKTRLFLVIIDTFCERECCGVLQCVAVRCSALQCVAVCRCFSNESVPRVASLNTIATHCNSLQLPATPCNSLQLTATHCNSLQLTATHCNSLQLTAIHLSLSQVLPLSTPMQHTATHCNSLQHAAIHCNSQQLTATHSDVTLQNSVLCNALQCVAVVHRGCNTLQHTATHRNTLQHTATRRRPPHREVLCCSLLQRFTVCCNELRNVFSSVTSEADSKTHSHHTLQLTATHCNSQQLTATHCNSLQRTRITQTHSHRLSFFLFFGIWCFN